MENQTRFDLNAAVENWRAELAAQTNLTADDRRELETHLRDTITGLRQRGLNDEESFWLARRRVGQPQQLGEEFAKADPAKIWRERFYWMAVALVGSYAFITGTDMLGSWLNSGWVFLFYLIPCFTLVGIVIAIRGGCIPSGINRFETASKSSWKLAWKLCVTLIIVTSLAIFIKLPEGGMLGIGLAVGLKVSWVHYAVWPAVMVLTLLLMPTQNRKTPKRA